MFLNRTRKPRRRPVPAVRPRLEALEDRTVPTIPGLVDVAAPDAYAVPSNSVLRVDGEGVLTNDMVGSLVGIQPLPGGGSQYGTSYDGSQVLLDTAPLNGTLIWSGWGDFIYTPRPGFTGADVFTYHIRSWYTDYSCYCTHGWDEPYCECTYDAWYAESNPTPVTITVLPSDNQPLPEIGINDVAVAEGNAGSTFAVFTVTLSRATADTVTVDFDTAPGTAQAGYVTKSGSTLTWHGDYKGGLGRLTFNPGETSKTIAVEILGDTAVEPDETFVVNLSKAVNAWLADGQGQGTIVNDDSPSTPPGVSVGDVSMAEGQGGSVAFVFTVSLSAASSDPIAVSYTTADGTAQAGSDYQAASGTLTFNPGETSKAVTVWVQGDVTHEADETYIVNLTGATNAWIADDRGQGAIVNDDARPRVSVSDAGRKEGHNGLVGMVFTLSLSNPSSQPVSVSFATADGTATSGSDYEAKSGTVTFAPGQTTLTVTVWVKGDKDHESDETFYLNLSGAVNADILDGQGLGTILNDDR